jgi:hypothetical protein
VTSILVYLMESKEDPMLAAAVPTAEMLGNSSHITLSGAELVNAAGNITHLKQSIMLHIHTSELKPMSSLVIDSGRIGDGVYEQGSSTEDDSKVIGGSTSSTSSIKKVCIYALPIQTTKIHQELRGNQEAVDTLLKGAHMDEGIVEVEEKENTSSKNKGKGRERNPSPEAISTGATVSQSDRDFGNTGDPSSGGIASSLGVPGQVWAFCIGNVKITLLLIGKYIKLVQS